MDFLKKLTAPEVSKQINRIFSGTEVRPLKSIFEAYANQIGSIQTSVDDLLIKFVENNSELHQAVSDGIQEIHVVSTLETYDLSSIPANTHIIFYTLNSINNSSATNDLIITADALDITVGSERLNLVRSNIGSLKLSNTSGAFATRSQITHLVCQVSGIDIDLTACTVGTWFLNASTTGTIQQTTVGFTNASIGNVDFTGSLSQTSLGVCHSSASPYSMEINSVDVNSTITMYRHNGVRKSVTIA
jgi:hypothetical protein